MTKRIAISILLTVWLVLILAGALAYFVTRSLLIADLDATLLARLASLPSIERPASLAADPAAATDARDRYVIQNPQGQRVRPSDVAAATAAQAVPPPRIIAPSTFSRLPSGERIRTITVQAYAKRTAPSAPLVPVTVVYSGPADHLDHILKRLLLSLGVFGFVAGIATAGVAVAVARHALRPIHEATRLIAGIDENNLDSRLPVDRLPSELQPSATRFNELLERLETAFAQRKQFLGDASHELRTPVAALMTTLEVTLHKNNRSTEDYVRALQACLDDARLLHQLVATLMDQVRSEQFAPGSEALDIAPVRLTHVLQHCAKIAQALAASKNIQLTTDLPEDLTVLTDELKVRSIVTNLLSNAVEYTPAGGRVSLAAELLPLAENRLRPLAGPKDDSLLPQGVQAVSRLLRISVADTGPGVAPEHLPHLFEPFYRADKARTNPQNHLGLGLFLVREHARRLHGESQVESILHEGATFTIDLPVAVIGGAADPVAEPRASLQGISG